MIPIKSMLGIGAGVTLMLTMGDTAHAQSRDSAHTYGPDTSPAQAEPDRTVDLPLGFGPSSHIFLMPTANPIGGGHGFIDNDELLFLYCGVGIGDHTSLTVGSTTIPFVGGGGQVMSAQLKYSFADQGAFNFAVGASASWFTSHYFFAHAYAVTTLLYNAQWWITAMFHVSVAAPELVDATFGKNVSIAFRYDNPFGLDVGLETRPFSNPDVRVIAEFWNLLAGMVGVRFGNDLMQSTFGFIFAGPMIPFPVIGFSWTW